MAYGGLRASAAAHAVASRGLIVHSGPEVLSTGSVSKSLLYPGVVFKDLGAMFFVCSIMDSLSLSTCDTCRLRVQVARSSRTVDRDRTGLTESSVPLRCPPRPPTDLSPSAPSGSLFSTNHAFSTRQTSPVHCGAPGPSAPRIPWLPALRRPEVACPGGAGVGARTLLSLPSLSLSVQTCTPRGLRSTPGLSFA